MPVIKIPLNIAIRGTYMPEMTLIGMPQYGAENPDGLRTYYTSGYTHPSYPTTLFTGHAASVGFFTPPTDVDSLIVTRCQIKISGTQSIGKQLTFGIPKTKASTAPTNANAADAYNAALNAQAIQIFPAYYSFAAGVSISITKAQLLQILNYGLSLITPKDGVNGDFLVNKSDVYIEVEYADPLEAPTVTAISPNATSVTTGEDITLTWSYYQTAGVAQASYSIDISADGRTWISYASDVSGPANSFTIPANTLAVGSYQWRVKAKSANGIESAYSIASFEAVMGIYMPSVCRIVRPRGTTIIGTEDNTFEWSYSQSVGSPQTHYDLQVSYNSGTTWTTLKNKVAGSVTSVVIARNTLNTGSVYWRVRTYHSNGTIVSDWDETAIIVFANPGTATIQCDGKPRPLISWNAISGQQSFQVQIIREGETLHDSRTVYSTARSYTPDYLFLPDGVVTVRVRVQNNLGVWGNWAEIYSTIKNTLGSEITLSVQQSGNDASLIYSSSGSYAKYYVYRDGRLIAVTANTEYIDHFANGNHIYFVRGETSARDYTDSSSLGVILNLSNAVISAKDNIQWINLIYTLGSRRKHQLTHSNEVILKKFAGRKYPVACIKKQTDRNLSTSVMFESLAEAETFLGLSDKPVIYKDIHGMVITGVLRASPMVYENGIYPYVYSVSFTLTQTDFAEVNVVE